MAGALGLSCGVLWVLAQGALGQSATGVIPNARTKAPTVVIDRVVAVVDGEVITESEVLTQARIGLVMARGRAGIAALAHIDEEILRLSLDHLVNQVLLDQRLRRLGAEPLPEAVVMLALRRFIDHFDSSGAYEAFQRRYGIPEEVILASLRRDLENARYLQERLGLVKKNRSAGGTPAAVDGAQGTDAETVRRWLEQLRRGVEIRLRQQNGELEIQK